MSYTIKPSSELMSTQEMAYQVAMQYWVEKIITNTAGQATASGNVYQPFVVDGVNFENNPVLGFKYVEMKFRLGR